MTYVIGMLNNLALRAHESIALCSAGLFSGVVLIWDSSNDDVIYSSESHEDPVTCLAWLEEKNPKYVLRITNAFSD